MSTRSFNMGMEANENGMPRDASSLEFYHIDEAEWLRGWDEMQAIREEWEEL